MRYLMPILLICIGVLYSCGENKAPKKTPEAKQKSHEADVEVQKQDTVWMEETGVPDRDWEWEMDSTILIDNEKYYLSVSAKPNGKRVEYISVFNKNDSVHAKKSSGPDIDYRFRLFDPNDLPVFDETYSKEDFVENDIATYVSVTQAYDMRFTGYLKEFKAFLFEPFLGFPASDNIIIYPIIIDFEGKLIHKFSDGHVFEICDCDYSSSLNRRSINFCTRIIHSDGKTVSLTSDEFDVAGSFVLNDDYSLVIYTYQGKPPFNNGKILDKNGRTIKTFDFEGIDGDMSYMIPKFDFEENNELYLVDGVNECLLKIDRDTPIQVERILFTDLHYASEDELLNPKKISVQGVLHNFDFFLSNGQVYGVK